MHVKICGVTSVEDAVVCVDEGADAIGLNFWPQSPRRCDVEEARRIVSAVGAQVRVVAVVVDASPAQIEGIREATGLRWVQLHGDEPPSALQLLLPEAYKAVRVGGYEHLTEARSFGGDELLVDARVEGMPGGTGRRADWTAAAELADQRRVWLAGGLRPENIVEAIAAVRPYGVDVASGVERKAGRKDRDRVRRFLDAAKSAS